MRVKSSFKRREQESTDEESNQFRINKAFREISTKQLIDKVAGKWIKVM